MDQAVTAQNFEGNVDVLFRSVLLAKTRYLHWICVSMYSFPMAAKDVVEELLALADIHVDGGRPWDIQVHDDRFYRRVLADRRLGLGESYMDGWWDAECLDEMVERMMSADLENKLPLTRKLVWHTLKALLFNMQNKTRAWVVNEQHYDLGNDLFKRMLDPRMVYSCGYWEHTSTLAQAQEDKLDLVCRKIGARPNQLRIWQLC